MNKHWVHTCACEESICRVLTRDIDLGLIVRHTKPAKILVTSKPSVNKSALDYELQSYI